jgi:L-rhamnose-H+ transport protein
LERFDHAGRVDQRFYDVPAVVGSLHVDPLPTVLSVLICETQALSTLARRYNDLCFRRVHIMIPNPALGVVFHWLGGLAAGSFYVPFRGVRRWSWETYWLVGGFFSWIIAPWVLALLMTNDLPAVLSETSGWTLFWCVFWGMMWGFGGLTFGLTMRYLGMSLGMAIVMGLCAAFGTLMPPIFDGVFLSRVVGTPSGQAILVGIAVCLIGIAFVGKAGMSKEKEMSAEQKQVSIKEFNLKKGILVAIFSGVMSACFSYGLRAGDPIRALTLKHGTSTLWQGLPVLVVVVAGGFLTNFVWCVALNIKNRTGHEYFSAGRESPRVPMLANYLFSALAGTTWYFQFFFYTMGETQMGSYKFSCWTLQMASIIIFSSLWGIGLREWKGTSRRTQVWLTVGIFVLVASTTIIGYGNYLATLPPATQALLGR